MTVFSSLLFDTLDSIGYNQDVIRLRRHFWQQLMNVIREICNSKSNDIFAGSKAEGLTSFYQSDIDVLSVNTDVICTDNVAQFSQLPGVTVIHVDTSVSPPGYTRLKLVRVNRAIRVPGVKDSAFKSESNEIYLSSSLFVSSIKSFLAQKDDNYPDVLSGPAVQVMLNIKHADIVFGIPCYYTYLLQSWKLRKRHHCWPPVHVMEDAISMLGQVVPVGSKGSCDQWREWRFCFIESELKLTYNLNETQMKLYVVLKMVAKEILRQVSDEISSYIMKNVVYWLSELLPFVVFRSYNLFTLVLLSLRFLKSAISEWNWFPYYMIPGRNLLAERLTPINKRQLSGLIETLIQEGPQFLLRCTKLRTALNVRLQTPALLRINRDTRDRLELLLCYKVLLVFRNADIYYIVTTDNEISDIVLPDWRMMLLQGVSKETIDALMNEKKIAMLS